MVLSVKNWLEKRKNIRIKLVKETQERINAGIAAMSSQQYFSVRAPCGLEQVDVDSLMDSYRDEGWDVSHSKYSGEHYITIRPPKE